MVNAMPAAAVKHFGQPLLPRVKRKRGACALVGLPPGDFPRPLLGVAANCITVRGSSIGMRRDMAGTLAFAADGHVHAGVELQPLPAVNDVFQRLAQGDAASRVILDFSA